MQYQSVLTVLIVLIAMIVLVELIYHDFLQVYLLNLLNQD